MGSKGATTTTNQQQTYSPAGGADIRAALNKAQGAANLPFNIPQAPVAGFSQDQLSAFQNVNNAQGMAQPYINQAQNYFQQSAQRPDVQSFYNPMAANVTSQLQNIFGQQNAQNTGQLTQAAGGVGADRIAVGQANLANQQGLAAGQTYANLWQQAQGAAQQQQSALQSAGYGTAALGSQAQNAALQGAQAQLGTGGLQQQLSQAQLNAPYQQQLAQAAFPYQQAQFLAGITGSLAPGLGGTTQGTGSQTTPGPSIWSQILGLGTAGVGAAGGAGAFGKGSAPSRGGGSATSGDAYGGNSANPLPGLTSQDYGFGYASGGGISDEPIDVAPSKIIPDEKLAAIDPHVPQLNLTPQQSGGGGGGGGGGVSPADVMKLAMAFMARGGSVNPFAGGGKVKFSDLHHSTNIEDRRDEPYEGPPNSPLGDDLGNRSLDQQLKAWNDVSYAPPNALSKQMGVGALVKRLGYADGGVPDANMERAKHYLKGMKTLSAGTWTGRTAEDNARDDLQTMADSIRKVPSPPVSYADGGATDDDHPPGFDILAKAMNERLGGAGEASTALRARGADMLRAAMTNGSVNPNDPVRLDPQATSQWRQGVDTGNTDAGASAPAMQPAKIEAESPPAAAPAAAMSTPEAEAAPAPSGEGNDFIKSPWAALMAAGLGIAGGTSPFAGVNIGQGGLQGLKMLEQQRTESQKDTTIAQAAKRLEQEAKFHEDQYTRATPYQQFEMQKPVPMGQRIDPLTGQTMTTYGQRQPDGTIKPIDPTAPAANPAQAAADDATLPANAKATQGFLVPGKNVPDNVDPSVLANQDPGIANMVRAIDEGRESISRVPMKQRYMVERLLHAYDPGFDGTVWNLRNKQQADLATNGTAGKMLTAVNQLLPHLQTAFDKATELANANYPAANTIKNWWLTQTGDPRVKTFQTVREVAAMDAARLLRGSGQMAEADINEWRRNISEAGSPAQLHDVIKLLADDLIGARISSIQHEYRQNMRQEPPEFLSPQAKAALGKMTGGGNPANAAAPAGAAPAAPKVGDRKQFKQGWGVWNGTAWVPAGP